MCHYSEQVEWETFNEAVYAAEDDPGSDAADEVSPDADAAAEEVEPVAPSGDD